MSQLLVGVMQKLDIFTKEKWSNKVFTWVMFQMNLETITVSEGAIYILDNPIPHFILNVYQKKVVKKGFYMGSVPNELGDHYCFWRRYILDNPTPQFKAKARGDVLSKVPLTQPLCHFNRKYNFKAELVSSKHHINKYIK